MIHLGTVKAAVAGAQSPSDGLLGLIPRHHVQAQLQSRHGPAVWELQESISIDGRSMTCMPVVLDVHGADLDATGEREHVA